MKISKNFEAGSIEVVSIINPLQIQLALRRDTQSCTKQWFYFELSTDSRELHRLHIVNADKASFPDGWDNYQVLASYDQKSWFRVNTWYADGELVFEVSPSEQRIFFAYFVPYTQAQHQALVRKVKLHEYMDHSLIGYSIENKPIDLFTVGTPSKEKKRIWMIARQHSGETMAQWFLDGVVSALTEQNKQLHDLLQKFVFYLVPNMNPDGSICGNHRTNSAGINLNRVWGKLGQEGSPEVQLVSQAIDDKGVDVFFDVHGDEGLPFNFAMVEKRDAFGELFKEVLLELTGDFQTQYDYNNQPGECKTSCCRMSEESSSCGVSACGAASGKATEYISNKYHCPAILLELPFKELENRERESEIWTDKECQRYGRNVLLALNKAMAINGQLNSKMMC